MRKMKDTRNKLSGKQKLAVCEMLALGYSSGLVVQELKDEYGIETSRHNIRNNYAVKKKKFILKLRDRMNRDLANHAGMQKSTRLNALLTALREALHWRTDKLYFDKDGELRGRVEKKSLSTIAKLVEQLRIEAEGVKDTSAPVFTLLNIIKNYSGNGELNPRTEEQSVDNRLEGKSDTLDKQSLGNIRIL